MTGWHPNVAAQTFHELHRVLLASRTTCTLITREVATTLELPVHRWGLPKPVPGCDGATKTNTYTQLTLFLGGLNFRLNAFVVDIVDAAFSILLGTAALEKFRVCRDQKTNPETCVVNLGDKKHRLYHEDDLYAPIRRPRFENGQVHIDTIFIPSDVHAAADSGDESNGDHECGCDYKPYSDYESDYDDESDNAEDSSDFDEFGFEYRWEQSHEVESLARRE